MLNSIFKNSTPRLPQYLKIIIFFTPISLVCFQSFLFVYPASRDFGIWLLLENNPIELLIFIMFFFGGVYGIGFSFKISKSEKRYVALIYFIFSVCLILLAMEEVSWGQSFFHFETHEQWKAINYQGETTLHNLNFMQSKRKYLLLIFGLSGLIGFFLRNHSKFKKIGVPIILLPWFILIVCYKLLFVLLDIAGIKETLYKGIDRFSEMIELLIAGSSFFYLWLNRRRLTNTDDRI